MCKALDYTQKIANILQDAEEERKRLYNLVHECDCEWQRISLPLDIEFFYHIVGFI